jgi:hypothetical protein
MTVSPEKIAENAKHILDGLGDDTFAGIYRTAEVKVIVLRALLTDYLALRSQLSGMTEETSSATALTELQHRRAPDGWVLVPREPTIDMASAGWDAIMAHTGFHEVDDRAEKAYRAMLAASPSSPASGVRVSEEELIKLAGEAYDKVLAGDLPDLNPFAAVVRSVLSALGEHP